MKTLFLHIGAPKTGSSYLQTCLRMSRETLYQKGLLYPVGTEETNLQSYNWCYGNANGLFYDQKALKKVFDRHMKEKSCGLVLSSESLLVNLGEEKIRCQLSEITIRYGFEKVKFLIYLRDPIQSVVSYWLQVVKHLGQTDGIDDFISKDSFIQNRMKLTAEVLEYIKSNNRYTINAINYSHPQTDIILSLCDWLDIGREEITIPSHDKVNRSLDQGEAILQMELNRILGTYANFLGKALTERITDIRTAKPCPSQELQEYIWKETKPFIDRINRFLPEDQGLVFDKMTQNNQTDSYQFTEEQIRVIAEALGGEVKRLWNSETKTMALIRKIKKYIYK